MLGFHHQKRGALGAGFGIGLGDHDDEVGVLTIGNEGLGAVEQVAVAGFLGTGAHPLQI